MESSDSPSFRGRCGDFHFAFFQLQAYRARAFVGKLGDAKDGRVQVGIVQRNALVVVFGQDGFEVGELSGELARGEQARSDAEEESGIVLGELNIFGVGGIEQET